MARYMYIAPILIVRATIVVFTHTKINEFRGVEYSAAVADFFTYDNLRPAEDWHPKIQDVVYWGKLILWSKPFKKNKTRALFITMLQYRLFGCITNTVQVWTGFALASMRFWLSS